MPAEVERIAHALIEAGAHFEIEALRDGYISLECLCGRYEDSGDPVVLAHELCANGPPVLEAVAKLVRDAYTFKFGGVPS